MDLRSESSDLSFQSPVVRIGNDESRRWAGSLVCYYSEFEPTVLGLVCNYSEFELTVLGTRITRMWVHARSCMFLLLASRNQEPWDEDAYGLDSLAFAALASYELSKPAWRGTYAAPGVMLA